MHLRGPQVLISEAERRLLPRMFVTVLTSEHVEGHHDAHQVVTQNPRVGHLTGIYRGHHVAQRVYGSGHSVFTPRDGVRPPLVIRHPLSVGPQVPNAIVPVEYPAIVTGA